MQALRVAQTGDPLTDRLPPQNRDAERGILGGILRDPHILPDVQRVVTADNFYYDAHQKIYQALCQLADDSQPIDLVLLHERLRRNQTLDDAGGVLYLTEIWEAVPTGANAEYHAKLVREAAMLRGLIHTSNEIIRDAYDRTASADELVGLAERRILDVARASLVGEAHDMRSIVVEAMSRIDLRAGKGSLAVSGVSTGFVDLDNLTAGLQNSELIVVGARPSVGKTALGIGIIRNVALGENVPTLFVSLEMSRAEIAERLLCCDARVDNHLVRKGHLSHDNIQKLMDAGDRLRRARLHIDDTPCRSMVQIAATCRRVSAREQKNGGLKLVVVDYLQMIEPEDRRAPRQEQVAAISRRLKHLARELKIPVLALCQVNRASEDRQDHKPRLSDLRESGGIEADADTVLLLHRPGRYDTSKEDNILEVEVAKQRNGPTGEVTLTFHRQYTRFENYLAEAD